MKELLLRKCKSCNALVKVLEDCNCGDCGIICCGEKMEKVLPNSVDASFEKHVPTYEVNGDEILVKVNHVMDEDHFIEWISIVSENEEKTTYFKPGEEAKVCYKYVPGSMIYAYCNKHGLWKTEVK